MSKRKNTRVPIPGGTEATIYEPLREEFPSNLGGAIEYRLCHVLYSLAKITGSGLGMFFGSFLVHTLEILRPELIKYVSPFLDEILEIPDLPPGFRQFISSVSHGEGQAAAALLSGLGASAGGAALGGLIPTLLSPATFALASAMSPARPSPAEAFAMYWRGEFDWSTLTDQLRDTGWHSSTIDAFRQILQPRISEIDLFRYRNLTSSSTADVLKELSERGWDSKGIEQIKVLARQVPGPGDQVRFALREAWVDNVADKFGYDEDMPKQFTDWMSRLGFDAVWARNFWRAHWDLPSIQAGFEMLHRRVIDESDLDTLLRVSDIPSYWRKALKQISYRPYTRVDVRRMHKMGTISDEQLVNAYRDLGFDIDHATGMAEFTIAYNTNTDKEYSEGEIREGYRLRAISYNDALQLLISIGQSQAHAEYVLEIENYKFAQKLQVLQIKAIKTYYITGELNVIETKGQLGELDMRGEQVDILIQEWDLIRKQKVIRPTKADIRKFYKQAIITREQVQNELLKRHIPGQLVVWYLESWDSENARETQIELEQQQAEQERLRLSTFGTDRMLAIQRINVLIAEQRTIIADAQLALTEIRPATEVVELKESIRQGQLKIAHQTVQIKNIQALIIRTRELIRITPEPKLVDTFLVSISETKEHIAESLIERDELETYIARLEVLISESVNPIEIIELEQRQVQFAYDIEMIEDTIAQDRAFIVQTQGIIVGIPDPEALENLREQISGSEYEIAELQTTIAETRFQLLQTGAELDRMLTPEQANELHRTIFTAKSMIRQLQVEKAQIPVATS